MPDPTLSIVIPVRNGGAQFRRCLAAIESSTVRPDEVIVVDDGSQDGTGGWAREAGATVLDSASPGGPALARNLGAAHAAGDILFFCDADVEIRPDTIARIRRAFADDPPLAALFGSYDDSPGDSGFLSQYKNLFHHYVHQHGSENASTFWSGCGAIRRDVFLKHGGFSTSYRLPSIEDIELGYRLRCGGCRIRLDRNLQVKHLKRWTLRSLLHSDIVARGIPWTRLILREGAFLNDLNLQTHNRVSVIAAYAGLLFALAGLWQAAAFGVSAAAALALIVLNWPLYSFFAAKRGGHFALAAVAAHWLYYFYNGLSFGAGLLIHYADAARRALSVEPAGGTAQTLPGPIDPPR